MTAAVSQFINFLVADMEAEESTDFADDLLEKAKAQITAGNGQLGFFSSGTINGKTFAQSQVLTALDVAYAVRRALDIYGDTAGSSPITFADFSGI